MPLENIVVQGAREHNLKDVPHIEYFNMQPADDNARDGDTVG